MKSPNWRPVEESCWVLCWKNLLCTDRRVQKPEVGSDVAPTGVMLSSSYLNLHWRECRELWLWRQLAPRRFFSRFTNNMYWRRKCSFRLSGGVAFIWLARLYKKCHLPHAHIGSRLHMCDCQCVKANAFLGNDFSEHLLFAMYIDTLDAF